MDRRRLARWSLADGTLSERGKADWGLAASLSETGALRTWRQSLGKTESCAVFSRGTAATGAQIGEVVASAWPPTPGKSRSVCLPLVDNPRGPYIVGVDVDHGAVVATDDAYVYKLVRAGGGAPVVLDHTPKAHLDLAFSRDGSWICAMLCLYFITQAIEDGSYFDRQHLPKLIVFALFGSLGAQVASRRGG